MSLLFASDVFYTFTTFFLAIVYVIMIIIFICALIIAPIMIWKWTKKTCKEVEELRSQLSLSEATNIKYLKSINNHLDRIDKIATTAFVEEEGS